MANVGQLVYEAVGGGAGAYANDAFGAELGCDEV